ncbi:hypothetical protein LQT98_21755, partial [Chromobacterium aquaticum]|uniref:hypothetical protein n=1 Tax=Chromobacterium aquaticum TaxID=467180 RepID=UPI001E3F48FA
CASAGWMEMGVETKLSAHVPPVHSAFSLVSAWSRLSSRDRKHVLSGCADLNTGRRQASAARMEQA